MSNSARTIARAQERKEAVEQSGEMRDLKAKAYDLIAQIQAVEQAAGQRLQPLRSELQEVNQKIGALHAKEKQNGAEKESE